MPVQTRRAAWAAAGIFTEYAVAGGFDSITGADIEGIRSRAITCNTPLLGSEMGSASVRSAF